MKASVVLEAYIYTLWILTLTASIHPTRCSRVMLLHSRRMEGLSQRFPAITPCPSRAATAKASFANRETSMSSDEPCWSRVSVGKKEWKRRKGGDEVNGIEPGYL